MRNKKLLCSMLVSFLIVFCNGQEKAKTGEDLLKENNVSRKEKFESKEGGFKIDFPCEPMKSEKQIDTDFGNTTIYFFSCGNEIADYSVSFQDYTRKITNPKDVFNKAKQMRIMGLEESVKIISNIEKTVNGFPANFFETELNAGDVLPNSGLNSELHALKGQRYYSVNTIVICKQEQKAKDISAELKDKTKKFIESFEIVESK